jgi:hypothetical protein
MVDVAAKSTIFNFMVYFSGAIPEHIPGQIKQQQVTFVHIKTGK